MHHKQQSLSYHPLRGAAGSPALEPAQVPEVFGDSGVVDQLEELWPSEGQMLLRHHRANIQSLPHVLRMCSGEPAAR